MRRRSRTWKPRRLNSPRAMVRRRASSSAAKWCLKKEDVVDHGLDAQDVAELVVHVEGDPPHLVADACALDPGVEVLADLAEVARIQLLAQEGGHVLGANHVDGRADEVVVEGTQILLALEDDVRGILDLHEAPVIAGRELASRGAERAGEALQLPVQRLGLQAVGDLPGPSEVLDLEEGVVRPLPNF